MVLKMTMSFTRSMAPSATLDSGAADAAKEAKAKIARSLSGVDRNQSEEKEDDEEVLADVGLDEEDRASSSSSSQDAPDQEHLARPGQSQKSPQQPQRGPVPEALHVNLIEISLAGEHHGPAGTAACDLDAIDELIDCAKEGDLPGFRRLCASLRRRHITPECAGYMGWTPAHWAAREGHLHILEYLRAEEAVNLDLVDKKGDSLLHKAAANGQFRVCQWLLQQGFNVQAKNNNGQTPLDVAQELLAMTRSSEAALCEQILAQEDAHTF